MVHNQLFISSDMYMSFCIYYILPRAFYVYIVWVHSQCILLWGHSSHSIPPPSLHGGEESPFHGSAPPNDTVNSEYVAGIKPRDSGV